MAKKAQAGLKELPVFEEAAPAPAQEPEAFEAPAAEPEASGDQAGPLKWRVSLNCPTPLAHKSLVVEAATEQEARDKFMAANGICDSRHDWTVVRVE